MNQQATLVAKQKNLWAQTQVQGWFFKSVAEGTKHYFSARKVTYNTYYLTV